MTQAEQTEEQKRMQAWQAAKRQADAYYRAHLEGRLTYGGAGNPAAIPPQHLTEWERLAEDEYRLRREWAHPA